MEQDEGIFSSICLLAQYLPDITADIAKLHAAERQYHHESIEALNTEMGQINAHMDRLTDLLINETITKEAYDRKFSQLQKRRQEISVMQEEHQGGNKEFKNALTTMISLTSKAPEIFKSSKTSVKRPLISLIFSNLKLSGENLQYSLRKPLVASFINYR